jgi:hypothetical protein
MIEEMKKQKKKSDNGEYDGLFGVMIRRQKKKEDGSNGFPRFW